MDLRYYGQSGEDFLLWKIFNYKPNGFYIDVGAFDGVHLSNTYSFEQQGWKGICIEPLPDYAATCKNNRPNSVCIQAACVSDNTINEVEFQVEELGLLSGITPKIDDVVSRYQNRGLAFDRFRTIQVPATTLNQILERYGATDGILDFMTVDVEGTELDVLKGMDLHRYRPRVIIVEANSQANLKELKTYLAQFGYHLGRSLSVNAFFVRNWLDAIRLQSIDVNCTIEFTEHPKGEKFTLQKDTVNIKIPSIQRSFLQKLRREVGRIRNNFQR